MEDYKKYLNKIFNYGAKKETWIWTSWYMGEGPAEIPTYYCLHYTYKEKILSGPLNLDILIGEYGEIAKIKEVPSEFLHEIIIFEFGV